MRKRMTIVAGLLAAAAATALSLAFVSGGEAKPAATTPTHTIFMTAVEWKGSADVAKEPYPGPVPEGGGYESFPPGHEEVGGDAKKWAIETYRFDTAAAVAYQGERVVLQIFGVNAAKHDIVVAAFKKSFTIKRGVVSRIDLGVMKKAGIYKIVCVTHPPSHQADLVVLPKS